MGEKKKGGKPPFPRLKFPVLTVWGGEIEVEIGDWILVPFSACGTQVAQILGFGFNLIGPRPVGLRIRVRKWRKASDRWTAPVVISYRAVLQGLSAAEARARAGPHAGIEA